METLFKLLALLAVLSIVLAGGAWLADHLPTPKRDRSLR